MSKPPLPDMFWHEARLSMFCLFANCILVVHAHFVCWLNFGQAGTFISWYCRFALQWLLKWGKSSKMQRPMWTSKQLFTTSSFVLECFFPLHNTELQTNLTLLWWCLVSQREGYNACCMLASKHTTCIAQAPSGNLHEICSRSDCFHHFIYCCWKLCDLNCFWNIAHLDAPHLINKHRNLQQVIPIFSPCRRQSLLKKHNLRSSVPVTLINLDRI